MERATELHALFQSALVPVLNAAGQWPAPEALSSWKLSYRHHRDRNADSISKSTSKGALCHTKAPHRHRHLITGPLADANYKLQRGTCTPLRDSTGKERQMYSHSTRPCQLPHSRPGHLSSAGLVERKATSPRDQPLCSWTTVTAGHNPLLSPSHHKHHTHHQRLHTSTGCR